jgi:N-6 DNA Methylase
VSAPPVTLGQIAELAGVRPSAVSNWRRRFNDFPHPTASAAGGRDLFSLADVETWLARHNRLAEAKESERLLFTAGDILRSELDVRQILDALCAALAFVFAYDDTDGAAGSAAFDRVTHDDPSAAEMFAPLATLKPETRTRLLELVGQFDRAAVPGLFDAVLARHSRFVETRTSDRLVDLLVRLSLGDPTTILPDRIFDPAVGQAHLLSAAAKAAGPGVEVAGQEINQTTWRIAKQRALVEGRDAKLALGDSLLEDAYPDLRAEVVLCDPPYGASARFPSGSLADGRWTFGLPRTGPADFAWLQHVIHHLTADGRGYVLLPPGTLFRGARDADVRARLLRRGAVEAIVALPPRAAEHTAISLALWIVRRPREESKPAVLLVNAASAGAKPGEPLDNAMIERVAETIAVWRMSAEVRESDRGFAAPVSVLDLLGPHATLRPARWVHRESDMDVDQRQRDFKNAVGTVRAARRRLSAVDIGAGAPLGDPRALAWISVRDLIADGRASIVRGIRLQPEEDGPSGTPVLRARDIQLGGRPPAAHVDLERLRLRPRLTCPGDIAVSLVDGRLRTMVDEHGGRVMALPVQALRLDAEWLHPAVAAAFLASPRNQRIMAETTSASAHVDLLELQLPAIPLGEAAELQDVLSRIEATELLAHETLTASRDARDALLDLGGYVAAPERTDAHDKSSRP